MVVLYHLCVGFVPLYTYLISEETSLLEFLSSESDSDLEAVARDSIERQREFAEIEPEVPFNVKFPTVIIGMSSLVVAYSCGNVLLMCIVANC